MADLKATGGRLEADDATVRRGVRSLRAGVVLCAAAAALASAGTGIDLAARVTPTEVTVGDLVRYEITVTHPANARVDLPAVRGNTGALEVLNFDVRSGTSSDGRATATYVLTLAAYAVGTDTLPPQRVEARFPPDTTATVLHTTPTVLTVRGVTPPDARDIAEIHDDLRLPRGLPWGLPLLLAALALAAWAWRRRRAERLALAATQPAPRTPSAAEAARARLDALEREALVAAGRSRAFAFALSEILRQYLAERFGIDALEATTAELLERAEKLPIAADGRAWLRDACAGLDTIKFADAALTPADEARLLDETRTFVRETETPEPAETARTESASP